MRPIDPGEDPEARKVVLAEHQPQYEPLPVLYYREGYCLSKWTLSADERGAIADGASIYLYTYTFGQSFQPVQFRVEGVTYEQAGEGGREWLPK